MTEHSPGQPVQSGGAVTPTCNPLHEADAGWADRHFLLFAFLGAIGVLFHEAQWYTFTDYFGTTIATGGALLVLCRPTAIWRWALMHLGIVIEVVEKGPFSSNHTVFHFILSLAMLAAVVGRLAAGGFKTLDRGEVFRLVAPVGRVLVLVLYFFTFWHKFNTGFFDPEISCGVEYYAGLRMHLPFLPDAQWTVWPSIIGTLVAELCLFGLILFRKTRLLGLLVCLGFHGVVGSMNHPNFSAIAYGYLILFLPRESSGVFVRRWQGVLKKVLGIDWAEQGARVLKALTLAGWIGTVAAAAWLVYALVKVVPNNDLPISLLREPWDDPRNVLQKNVKRMFQIYGVLIFLGVYVVGLWKVKWSWSQPFYRFRQPWVYVFPVLMIAHGMGPYFGSRTDSSFSMFSNLITEPGHANHAVLSGMPQIMGFQADRVTIVQTDDPELAEFAPRVDENGAVVEPKKPYALHWTELQRYVQRKVAAGEGDFSVTYLRGEDMLGVIEEDRVTGRLVEVENVGTDPELNEPQSLLMKKYMYLRPYKHGERNSCDH